MFARDGTPLIAFSWRQLFKAYFFLLGKRKWKWLALMAALFVVGFYMLVPPLILGKLVDFFTEYSVGDSLSTFYFYVGALAISFIAAAFIRTAIKRTLGNMQSEVTYEIKVKGFEKLLDFSMAWHLEEGAGVKSQKIKSGVESYKSLNQKFNNEIMRSLVSTIGVVTVFAFLQPKYVLFFIAYVVIFWMIVLVFSKKIQEENTLYYLSLEKAGGSYVEGLSNIMTIKTLGANSSFQTHVASKELATKEHEYTLRSLNNALWKTFHTFNGICYGVFLLFVGQDIASGVMSVGSLVIFYGYLQSLVGNSADLMDTYDVTLSAKSGVGRMMDIFWTKPVTSEGDKKLPKKWDALTLENAHFTYGERGAIANLSLDIPRFAKVGVVGKTGSGKSTLAKIFAGLYQISSGDYKIGGVSFYDLTHDEQTKNMTLVLQETEVFNLSIKDNITLMKETDPKIFEMALEISQLKDLVESFPDGIETLVGEKGYHLSGGERQRLGIARAICKDAPIMIFDEATSSLDSKTEKLIQTALETKLKDKTIITIAHRVSTLQKTDVIYVFDNGKIVESGKFKDLSKNKDSKFYELYHTQKSA